MVGVLQQQWPPRRPTPQVRCLPLHQETLRSTPHLPPLFLRPSHTSDWKKRYSSRLISWSQCQDRLTWYSRLISWNQCQDRLTWYSRLISWSQCQDRMTWYNRLISWSQCQDRLTWYSRLISWSQCQDRMTWYSRLISWSQCQDRLTWYQWTVTGWDSKSDLQLLPQNDSTYNCQHRSVPDSHFACC